MGIDTTDSNAKTVETYQFDWTLWLAELETKENEMLPTIIRECPLSLTEQKDEKGFNLLHHAVLKCIPGKVQTLITLVQQIQGATEENIKVWVNARTLHDQFSPLHLASFKGNMDAVYTLIKYGADPFAENVFGLNMVHVAA